MCPHNLSCLKTTPLSRKKLIYFSSICSKLGATCLLQAACFILCDQISHSSEQGSNREAMRRRQLTAFKADTRREEQTRAQSGSAGISRFDKLEKRGRTHLGASAPPTQICQSMPLREDVRATPRLRVQTSSLLTPSVIISLEKCKPLQKLGVCKKTRSISTMWAGGCRHHSCGGW